MKVEIHGDLRDLDFSRFEGKGVRGLRSRHIWIDEIATWDSLTEAVGAQPPPAFDQFGVSPRSSLSAYLSGLPVYVGECPCDRV